MLALCTARALAAHPNLVSLQYANNEVGVVQNIPALAALCREADVLLHVDAVQAAGHLAIPLDGIKALAHALEGHALVVVDEAYGEFADGASATTLLGAHANVAVLRTLSKAHALAAARIGVVVGGAELVAVLQRCQAPYPVPTPCADLALEGLSDTALEQTRERVAVVRRERERLLYALARIPGVRRVYPSQGNYLLVRFDDPDGAFHALLAAGVVVRDQRAAPQLDDALRITIGSPEQNDRVLSALNTNPTP